MHPYLVGSARLKPAGKQPNRLSFEKPRGKHLVVGRCRLAPLSIDNRHALTVAGVPAHGRFNLAFHKPGSTAGARGLSMPADGQIMPKDRLTLQLPDQAGLAGQRFGHHHKTRGVPIETMDNAGPRQLLQLGPLVKKSVKKGAGPMPCCRMHHQVGRLIDDNKLVVFKNNG